MDNARGLVIVAAACLAAAGCWAAPTEPKEEPRVEACERLGYAPAEFINGSQRSSYDVLVNGTRQFQDLTPGTMGTGPLAAGVSHTIVFRYAGTSTNACSAITIVPIACVKESWRCSADR